MKTANRMTKLMILIVVLVKESLALNNGLALTPPMGWMAWERYRCITDCETYPDECISEKLFRNVADVLVRDGYREAGYEYVIIDDCWLEKERSPEGKLQADKKRFPNGIKELSKYIHSKGLKFGLYEDYGNKTCAGYPGIIDNLEKDANTFAEWEVDYLKLDGCYTDPSYMDEGYWEFGRYLNKTGRPIVYSCSLPAYQEERSMPIDYAGLAEHCNLWRNYDDIQDSWQSLTDIFDYFAMKQEHWSVYAGPGHWNDPDMLLIGNYGLTYDQSKVQMALWAILAAPLLISTNLNTIRPEFKEILLNKEIIKVNQDPLGIQGKRIYREKQLEIWRRPITPIVGKEQSFAFAIVSRRDDGSPYAYNITIDKIGCKNPYGYRFYDLYDYKDSNYFVLKQPKDVLRIRINPSGVLFYKAVALEAEVKTN